MTSTQPAVQVVRGSLTDEELAALTAVLLARAATAAAPRGPVLRLAGRHEPAARWRRLERRPAYHSPVSWRAAA